MRDINYGTKNMEKRRETRKSGDTLINVRTFIFIKISGLG
jgi:hypothetical protein